MLMYSSERSQNAEPLLTDKKITRTFGNEYRRSRNLSRYNNAIKNLIPIRTLQTSENEMPIDDAGFFSTIFFSWITKYLWMSYRKGIGISDLPRPSPYDTADYNAKRLEALWNEEVMRHSLAGASFSRAAWKFIRTRILMASLIFGFSLILGFLGPAIVMRKLLKYVESPDEPFSTGIMWLFLLMISDFIKVALFNWGWSACYRTGLRMKSAYLTVMYRKLIKSKNLTNRDSGKFINMMANDGQSAFDLCIYTPQMIAGPVITILIISYILYVLSPIALVGFLFFFCFYPLQYLICRVTGYFKRESIALSDRRVSAVDEILNCIKLIKMYAWEDPFRLTLLDLRRAEKSWLEKMSVARSYGSSLTTTIPIISAIITFLVHVAAGNNLVAAQGFPIITIFVNQMKNCLNSIRDGPRCIVEAGISFDRLKVFPFVLLLNSQTRHIISFFEVAITTSINAKLSFGRMKEVMCMREVNCYIQKPIVKNQAVTILNGSFACDIDSPESSDGNTKKKKKHRTKSSSKMNILASLMPKRIEVLSDIIFEAPKEQLIGICGSVGSGKSSLLKAALGHLRMAKGKISRDGSCAYISQQPWILNTTFKENILFGKKFDSQRYYSAIALCCLQEDLDLLPAADDTEIGERGINLSGGQKQRIALARAYYADKDIYLLDDTLSAVDPNVGWCIFENLILSALKNKTVIFVSHQILYLNHCSRIYMMDNGRIVEHGDHVSLVQAGKQYATMVKNTVANEKLTKADDGCEIFADDTESPRYLNTVETEKMKHKKTIDNGDENDGALILPENIEKGEIKSDTYLMYINAMGGFTAMTIVIINVLLNSGCIQFSSWWLATWIKAGSGGVNITIGNETMVSENILDNPDLKYYETVYGVCIIAIIVSSVLRGFVLSHTALNASTNLHNKIFEKIVYASMQFFETTTRGRLQNIFSRDISELDCQLPLALEQVLNNIVHVILNVLIVCIILPYLTAPFVVLCAIFYFITKLFRKAIRDLRRHESVTRSPIFSLATTTLQGLDTIHAFEKESEFIEQFNNYVDLNGTCNFLSYVLLRWAAIRFDVLSIVAYLCTGLAIVLMKGHIAPAMAGLALSFCGQMTGLLQFSIRQLSLTELKFISVERIGYYLKFLKNEDSNTKAALVELEYTWPKTGKIEFNNVVLKYRHNTPIVLKNISFRVQAGEKIGIAGRTGSGKSSLMSALFRLVELHDGCIKIDDVDISTINIQQLRSKLSIIPQDPMIFSGTIKFNLDPWDVQTDDELWSILEKVNLKHKVSSMPGQLRAIVDSGDSNLSIGERQLLCLGRALLRKSKIIILDEATAAVDPQTELIVQMAIQKEFSDCTIITIAHRIQTILSCDQILVMDAGQIVELDTPHNLLENPDSEFSKMLNTLNKTANGR